MAPSICLFQFMFYRNNKINITIHDWMFDMRLQKCFQNKAMKRIRLNGIFRDKNDENKNKKYNR